MVGGGGCQAGQRGAQFGQDRVDDGVVGGDVDLDAAGQPVLGGDRGDHRVDLLGGPGDHGLAR